MLSTFLRRHLVHCRLSFSWSANNSSKFAVCREIDLLLDSLSAEALFSKVVIPVNEYLPYRCFLMQLLTSGDLVFSTISGCRGHRIQISLRPAFSKLNNCCPPDSMFQWGLCPLEFISTNGGQKVMITSKWGKTAEGANPLTIPGSLGVSAWFHSCRPASQELGA